MDIVGYELLANAIILRAVDDYRYCLAFNKQKEAESLERFFTGQWFHLLTKTDGNYIIQEIRKEYL